MNQRTNIARNCVSWRFLYSVLIFMCVIMLYILWHQQNYTEHIHWSILQNSKDGTERNESLTEVPVPTSRKTSTSIAEEHRLSASEILVPISREPSEVEEPVWGEDHIMFVDTSCILMKGEVKSLLPRQICSIESAAKTNPTRKVYVLHSCQLPAIHHGTSPIYSKYKNIKFWPLNLEHLIPRSPLEGWKYMEYFFLSKWPREQGSDVARLLALWQYGGTYFDTDVMLIRELSGITKENFICEENHTLGNAALRFLAHNETARQLLRTVLMQVRNDFQSWNWSYNGPGAFQRAVVELCTYRTDAPLPTSCMGVNLLPSKYFFEILHFDWKMLFNEFSTEQVIARLKGSYGVHFWNKLSYGAKVIVGSRQAYALLAQEHCPLLYASVESSF